MQLRFVSSLTPDDEERLAPALANLLCALLDQLPIAYTLRLETSMGSAIERQRAQDPLSPELETPSDN
jgi:hypothetical protein